MSTTSYPPPSEEVSTELVTEAARALSLSEASDEAVALELLRRVLGEKAPEVLWKDGTRSTPARMIKALRELTDGYAIEPKRLLTQFDSEGDPLVVVKDIEYSSLCEHHVLPFTGTVSVAYIPNQKIVGLSKIPRVVRAYSRRLQVQERLTDQVADSLQGLDPKGVAVLVRGVHSCCQLRGIERRAEMVTSALRGVFKSDVSARAEVMALLGAGR